MIPAVDSTRLPLLAAALLGALGLLATLFGGRDEALFSYLFAFLYWLTLCVGALFSLTTFHVTHARWAIVFRRPLEWASLGCLVFLPLFVPIAWKLDALYVWVHPPPQWAALSAQRHGYLNVGFFLVRAALYFLCWGGLAWRLNRWSTAQDAGAEVLGRQRWLSAASLPVLFVTLSFAALDWVMSLEPRFTSTLFGIYVFAGAVMAALSVVAVTAQLWQGRASFGTHVTAAHRNRLGALLLTFVCFWAYCAYSQGMLLWIAGLPAESAWLLARTRAGWRAIGLVLIAFHFGLPFFLLLSRALKQRGATLAAIAGGLLIVHAVDLYWLVLPALHPDTVHFHWTTLTAFVGVGGVVSAFVLWRARGQYALPVKEPYLPHSLEVPLT